jgi:hypothetical protein
LYNEVSLRNPSRRLPSKAGQNSPYSASIEEIYSNSSSTMSTATPGQISNGTRPTAAITVAELYLLSTVIALQGKLTPTERSSLMAKRKEATARTLDSTPTEETAAPHAETTVLEPPATEPPLKQWRADPFAKKTVNLDGYKVQLQESRRSGAGWQMQIKFGDGSLADKPSDAVLEALAAHKIEVVTKEGTKEVNQFRWNDTDRAWGMKIDFDTPNISRQKAEQVFEEMVELVAQDRGIGRER